MLSFLPLHLPGMLNMFLLWPKRTVFPSVLCFLAVVSLINAVTAPPRVLDLSNDDLRDSGVKLLCDGLKNPNLTRNTQIVWLYGDRGRLLIPDVGSEFKPLTPERAGSELRSPRRFRSEAAIRSTAESKHQVGETQFGTCRTDQNHTGTMEIFMCCHSGSKHSTHSSSGLSATQVIYVKEEHLYADHPERFEIFVTRLLGG